ncbi:MAG: TolC family protein [Rhodocyclaceae bacterium]|nr:TolC family protein [Rhodocyclaceae bacterium]
MKRALFSLAFSALAGAAMAAGVDTDLPPDGEVARILRAAPDVLAAGNVLRAEQARRQGLEAGTQEWTLRLTAQQRRAYPPAGVDERFAEQGLALERPIRLPGKAALDAEIGALGVAGAEWAEGDAMHERARALMREWFDWLREQAGAGQWAEQVQLLARHAAQVERRKQLGDASRLDAVTAAAALAQAEAQFELRRGRERNAAERLRRRYAGLKLPDKPQLSEPQPVPGSEAEWTAAIVENSHELGVARSQAARARAVASRAGRDRTPDPSLGLHLMRERGGEDRIIGLSLSIPLPGQARRAGADAERALAEAEANREAAALQKVTTEAASLFHEAEAARLGWSKSRQAAQSLVQAAAMNARAYELGEGSLSDVLAARRLAHEAQLAARNAQIDALELHYRLLLDAHRLWDFDRQED